MASSFTPLHPILFIALGDAWLGYSCSAWKPIPWSSPDTFLELIWTEGPSLTLQNTMHYDLSVPSFHVVCNFVAELILLLFCFNITDSWLWTGLVAQVALNHSQNSWNSRERLIVCSNSRHHRFTLFGWVSEYLKQYSIHVLICCHILGRIIKKYNSCTSDCGWSLHFRSFYVVIISNVHLDWDILLDGYWEA